jgi:Nidogen-like
MGADGNLPDGTANAAAATAIDPSLVNGLGGPSGFGTDSVPVGDDNSSAEIPITSVFPDGLNFFGQVYDSLYINTNGNITFTEPNSTFTPFQITASDSLPIIAPFFADVDTRGGPAASTGGNADGANLVYYNLDAAHHTLTVTWDDVGYYSASTDKVDAFQLQLIGEGGGNFDIAFRYQAVNWVTGDASGGTDGLGGTVARAGFSAGDGVHFNELPQSGNQSEMLRLPSTPAPRGTLGATGQPGVYVFHVRNGVVTQPQSSLFDFIYVYNDGKDYYSGTVADDGTFGYHAGQTIATGAGQYTILDQQNGSVAQSPGTVLVDYYSHGGPGVASTTPVASGAGNPAGTDGLGSEADAVLGTDGQDHGFSATSEVSLPTNRLFGFVYNYTDGGGYYAGTVADDGSLGYAAIAASANPFKFVTNSSGGTVGYYYLYAEGSTGNPSGSVIVSSYRNGASGISYAPALGGNGQIDGTGGLGTESDSISAGGANLTFNSLVEAHPVLAA